MINNLLYVNGVDDYRVPGRDRILFFKEEEREMETKISLRADCIRKGDDITWILKFEPVGYSMFRSGGGIRTRDVFICKLNGSTFKNIFNFETILVDGDLHIMKRPDGYITISNDKNMLKFTEKEFEGIKNILKDAIDYRNKVVELNL